MDQPPRSPESPIPPDRTRTEATPTPVRQGFELPPRDQIRGAEGPPRAFQAGGEEWVVSESGRTVSGRGTDPRVLLVLLFFAAGTDPDRPIREILIPERGLEELTDQELIVLLGRARPYRTDQDRKEVFPGTRKKGGKRP